MNILHLSKDNLKFSAAHFLIFDSQKAERLHGHNYKVSVQFYIDAVVCQKNGYGVDFGVLKSIIKQIVDRWDERVLLPQMHPDFEFKEEGRHLKVNFRDRIYQFPKDEVILLPIVNTSVEMLSSLLAHDLWLLVKNMDVLGVRVEVEETVGQSGSSFFGEKNIEGVLC